MIGFIKQDFVKKKGGGGRTKTFPIKRGVGAKGGLAKKRGVTFLRGGSYPGAHSEVLDGQLREVVDIDKMQYGFMPGKELQLQKQETY